MSETNYFIKPVTNLFPGTVYNFQFRWKYDDGTYGEWSATKSVLTDGTAKVESPTKATGLTATEGAFSLVVSWNGTYENNDQFLGFKAINIYASTSNLGASTTTNLLSNLVGSMTVDAVKNSVTVTNENLKGVLSLDSTTIYTTDIYLYYAAINENNEVYQEGGINTYYRINSSALRPGKANYIDLANGVISIENLTASTGQFLSYIRAGVRSSDGTGARVEISGSSTNQNPPTYVQDGVTRGGGTIYPGLTIYNSDGSIGFKAGTTGDVLFSGTLKTITDLSITQANSFSNPHPAYIEIPKEGTVINFYMDHVDGATNTTNRGYISVYDEAYVGGGLNEVGIVLVPPTYKANATSTGQIRISEYQVTGMSPTSSIYASADSVQLQSAGYLYLNGATVQIQSGNGVELMQGAETNQMLVRNIKATSSGVPSAGTSASSYNYGDIWFEYTA